MIWLAIAAAVVLVAVVFAAAAARRRLWGARARSGVPSPVPPGGSVVLAAANERGRHAELVPVLADWMLRGVVEVEKVGPSLPSDRRSGIAPGPVWQITAGSASISVDPVELGILGAMFGARPSPGLSVTVERDDNAWRERVSSAVANAVTAQREIFGAERPRLPWLGALLFAVAVLAGGALIAGAALAGTSLAGLAWLVVGVPITVTVVGFVVFWPAKSAAERAYLQATRDFRAWVSTTHEPRRELGGWAMVWNLPGTWSEVLPPEVSGLLHMDRSFVRGDFGDTIPEPYTYY